MNDLRNDWRGKVWSIRQTPRHWHIEDPDAAWDSARGMFWLVVKTLACAALVVLAYAVVL
jgi:hypothetical protein